MRQAELIKAGDNKLLINNEPPKVDCRVVADDNYNEILQVFKEIRSWDIKRYMDGSGELMPLHIRKKVAEFLEKHGL